MNVWPKFDESLYVPSFPFIYRSRTDRYRVKPTDKARMREALKRETKIQLEKKGLAPIATEDLISAPKKLLALGTLYASLVSAPSC